MKKIIAFFIILVMCFAAVNTYAETADEIEEELGIDIDTADAETLKTIVNAYDEVLLGHNQLIDKCLVRLVNLGEWEWVNLRQSKPVGDLSSMTIEDLATLKNKINLTIWASKNWQEVKVPQGVWKVGEDIPAGHWTLKCAEGASYSTIHWGEKLGESGDDIAYSGRYSTYNRIYNPTRYTNADNYSYQYNFEVQEGDYIIIENGSVIFMPYVGKPAFEFK